MDSARIASELQRDGYALVHDVIGRDAIDCLCAGLSNFSDGHARDGRTYAARNLLQVPAIAELACSRKVRGLVESVLGLDAFAVRGLLFDKLPEANWGLPWHQDLSIAVRERRQAPSFGPWSVKDGVTHVQPPETIMAGMLAVRVHLDVADRSKGAARDWRFARERPSVGRRDRGFGRVRQGGVDRRSRRQCAFLCARSCYTPRRRPNRPCTAG